MNIFKDIEKGFKKVGKSLGKTAGKEIGGLIGQKKLGSKIGGKLGGDLGSTAGKLAPGVLAFKKGGKVKKTGMALLHKGEIVLPAGVKPTKAQKDKIMKNMNPMEKKIFM